MRQALQTSKDGRMVHDDAPDVIGHALDDLSSEVRGEQDLAATLSGAGCASSGVAEQVRFEKKTDWRLNGSIIVKDVTAEMESRVTSGKGNASVKQAIVGRGQGRLLPTQRARERRTRGVCIGERELAA